MGGRLAKKEEKEAMDAFGERYEEYKRHAPMFLPSMKRLRFDHG